LLYFFAARVNTIYTIAWFIINIFHRPNAIYLEELQKEIDQRGVDSYTDVKNIESLERNRLESNRLYSSISPGMRHSLEPVQFGDITIPKDHKISFGVRAHNTSDKLYPNATTYNPNRWKDSSTPPIIIFGNGEHRCKGEQFALMSIKTVMTQLLSEYEVELVDGFPKYTWALSWPIPNTCKVVIKKRQK